VQDHLEFFTALRTMRTLERADLAVVLIDATDGVTVQDIKIIEQAEEVRKGILLVVNKWDIVEKESRTADLFTQTFYQRAPMMTYIPLVYVSALTGQRVTRTLDLALEINQERTKRITTAELNEFLREAVSKQTPPAHAGRFIKFYYGTQTEVAPPTFVFFVNYPQHLERSYLRFLENQLREKFGFKGNTVRMKFKKRTSKGKEGSH
jgi:GTP-binding protein